MNEIEVIIPPKKWVRFSEVQLVDCFYVQTPDEPYIKMPPYQFVLEGKTKEDERECNAMRLKSRLWVYIAADTPVFPLHSKLIVSEISIADEIPTDASK